MNFADNIDYPPLLRRPVVLLPILALIYLALLRADVDHWPVLLKALGGFGLAAPSGAAAGALVAAAFTALIGANAWIVLGLPSRWQVRAVWLELALLLGGFFYSFDLRYAFIRRTIWILRRTLAVSRPGWRTSGASGMVKHKAPPCRVALTGL